MLLVSGLPLFQTRLRPPACLRECLQAPLLEETSSCTRDNVRILATCRALGEFQDCPLPPPLTPY